MSALGHFPTGRFDDSLPYLTGRSAPASIVSRITRRSLALRYPEDTAWAHADAPVGVSVAYTDGHSEYVSDDAAFAYSQFAVPVYGRHDQFVMMFWEYLDGDPRRLTTTYWLPPELLE